MPNIGDKRNLALPSGMKNLPLPPGSDPNFRWPDVIIQQIFDGTNWVDVNSQAGLDVHNRLNSGLHSLNPTIPSTPPIT